MLRHVGHVHFQANCPSCAPVQAFCKKAKLSTLRAEGANEVDDEFLMVSNKWVTVKEVPVASMEHKDPFKAPLVGITGKVGTYILYLLVTHYRIVSNIGAP